MWQNQLDKHPNMKVIQVIRNPKDTLVSLYHHLQCERNMGEFTETWDEFFEAYKAEKIPAGDYFEVNCDWYKFNKDRKQSLVLVYEEMKKDPKAHVIKIANFVGLPISDKVADIITDRTGVKKMSEQMNKVLQHSPAWNSKKSNFVRKGTVGDWMNYFSAEQAQYVDAKCEQYLEPLGLKFDC